MRFQKIQRLVDARESQGRVILWLACGHKISFDKIGSGPVLRDPVGEAYPCRFCQDPEPMEPNQEKPAQQLWREANEP